MPPQRRTKQQSQEEDIFPHVDIVDMVEEKQLVDDDLIDSFSNTCKYYPKYQPLTILNKQNQLLCDYFPKYQHGPLLAITPGSLPKAPENKVLCSPAPGLLFQKQQQESLKISTLLQNAEKVNQQPLSKLPSCKQFDRNSFSVAQDIVNILTSIQKQQINQKQTKLQESIKNLLNFLDVNPENSINKLIQQLINYFEQSFRCSIFSVSSNDDNQKLVKKYMLLQEEFILQCGFNLEHQHQQEYVNQILDEQ